ncbi:MAG: hypothetical protein P9L92_06810 [Candidatus Electryonea clarkiae]|nr:hypothetical protein [Candidatus Electryonea clarkiae]MDP8285239.1 hypothetical protein [Candidatus Electryonea clarkiae]
MIKRLILFLIMLIFMQWNLSECKANFSIEEDYDWKTWKIRRSTSGFNGHGGFFYISLPFQSSDLDFVTNGMGLEKLSDQMTGMGGLGMGHIGSGWRIGGAGFSSQATSKGFFQDASGIYNRELELEFGGGGLIVEHSPWMMTRINFGYGSLIGFGEYKIKLQQNTGAFDWNDLYNQYFGSPTANHGYVMVNSLRLPFFLLQPYATARLHLIDWLAIEGAVGFNIVAPFSSSWEFEGRAMTGAGPEIEIQDPYYRIGLVFGG